MRSLLDGDEPDPSAVGVVLLAASVVVLTGADWLDLVAGRDD